MPRIGQVTAAEWLGLAAAVAVFSYVGWDGALWDARFQLGLHLLALGAAGGAAVLLARGFDMPRTTLELPILGLLAAFALATLGATNVGMSLRAMAAIAAFTLMLPVALVAVRRRPSWVGFAAAVPVLVLSAGSLVALVARRIEWLVVGAPGLPPIRLASEGTPFGSVAVPPFVIIPAWVLAGLIEHAGLRAAVRIGLVVVGVPLTILSGSRSAWLAIAVGVAVGAVPWAWKRRDRMHWPRRVTLIGAVSAASVVVVAALVVILALPRVTAVTSLLYRAALWRDTLAAWSIDPLMGIGPGFMPYARQAAAADFSFPVRQPHSHNLVLGVLGDAGILGLGAAIVVGVTLVVVAGPWRSRTARGRTAGIVLVGLGVGGLFEDLTFLPGFNLLVILLVAVALEDAGAVAWRPIRLGARLRRTALALGGLATALVLLAGMVVADAGAIAYRTAADLASEADWAGSARGFERAVGIDPWHPAGPRALAVAAAVVGEMKVARAAAVRATDLNPGDATAWLNRALLCELGGDRPCAVAGAARAAATARYLGPELLNAALLFDRLGERDQADRTYRLALLTQPAASFVAPWPRPVPVGAGTIPDITDASWQLNLLLARQASHERIDPTEFADPAVRALAHGILGERATAKEWLARALDEHPDDIRTHDINVVLHSSWSDPIDEAVRVASVVRGRPFPDRALIVEIPRITFDIGSFRAYPLDGFVPSAVRLATRPPFPWTLEDVLP
ncbi:MAG: O-antigen ligase family protein [Candidatus Limnocylindria bacterium]